MKVKNNKFLYLKCYLNNHSTKEEFIRLKQESLTKEEQKSFLTNYYNKKLIKHNNKSLYKIFNNKEEFNKTFHKYLDYDYLVYDNYVDFKKFVDNQNAIIADNKIIEIKKNNKVNIFEKLTTKGINYITSSYDICEELSLVNNNIPFIRFLIYKGEIITAYLFLEEEKVELFAPINIETGIVDFAFADTNNNTYTTSLSTNESLLWLKIPRWPRVKRFAISAFNQLEDLEYASFDITITKDKPLLIGGTSKPIIDYLQLDVHRNNNFGIMNKIRDIEKRK